MCVVSERDVTAKLIYACSLLVIDEVSILDRHVMEAADQTFCNIHKQESHPFGGLSVIFNGDWHQILPIVRNGGRPQIVSQCLKSYYLWDKVEVHKLTINIHIALVTEEQYTDREFAEYFLDVGEGKIPYDREHGDFHVHLNEQLSFPGSTMVDLCKWVFPNICDR